VNEAPLAGLTILDLSRVLSGPYCTMLAADMGARVIKIEHPERGDDTRAWGPPFLAGESAYYLSINRNKESVAIDFKTPLGRKALDELIARADVLVENFRPGTLDRLGLGYNDLQVRYPRLIYASISGFGLSGPRREEAGYDAVAQAEGGLMSITGAPDGPAVRLGVAIADIAAGMFAFQGILLALISRAQRDRGQHVDVSLLDSVAALLTYQAARYFATGIAPARSGNRHMTIAPYDTFEMRDGVLVLAIGTDAQWRTFCTTLARADLAADSRFATNAQRVERFDELRPLVSDTLAPYRLNQAVELLRDAGVPCGAVRSIAEALDDPQIIARAMIEEIDHPAIGPLKLLGLPVKLSATPGGVHRPPPRLGEHTRAVLSGDLGWSAEDVARVMTRA
jgi:crotonobetainyl-CoA:carnitine CoA-transferase CaiB-like acyl-CoA transferase